MTLGDTLILIWQQVLDEGKSTVDLEGKTYSVGRTRAKKLRTVRFDYTDYRLDGIEQNPATTSQWAALARGRGLKQRSWRPDSLGLGFSPPANFQNKWTCELSRFYKRRHHE